MRFSGRARWIFPLARFFFSRRRWRWQQVVPGMNRRQTSPSSTTSSRNR
jgi:hypothetical protein